MNSRGADASSLRQWNELAVLRALHSAEGASGDGLRVSELGQLTGLAHVTIAQALQNLQQNGWVAEIGPVIAGRGRPARLYRPASPAGSTLGLDVGAHSVRAVRCTLDGKELARAEVLLAAESSTRERHRAVHEVIRDTAAATHTGIPWATRLAVGGTLGEDGTVHESVAIPEWDGTRPAELFADLLPGRVNVVNDIHAACRAELSIGAARGAQEALFVHLGRRPTLGLVVGGKVRPGAHGLAGDLSRHATFSPANNSGEPSWARGHLNQPDPTAAALQACLEGDTHTIALIRSFVEDLTPALAAVVAALDPEVVVLAGAMTRVAPAFHDVLIDGLTAQLVDPPRIALSGTDQFATALGAALLAIRDVEDDLLGAQRT